MSLPNSLPLTEGGDQITHRLSEGRPAPPGDDASVRKSIDPWLVGRDLGDPIFQWELGVAVGLALGRREKE